MEKFGLALARAFYSRAQHLALDDPLSAVDSHTARHIFESFSKPLLKGRTILLVTHAIDLCLPAASYLVRMSEGTIILQEDVANLTSVDELVMETKIELGKESFHL
jgi:ABC-type transport system involved in cytochrome bd biosynthesis fused ATPase/permease subunit